MLSACGGGSKTDTPNSGNISPRVVTGIEITSSKNQPTTNDTAELRVMATFDDGTSKDVTPEIALESSNTEVVSVTDGTLITHEFVDEVTISATYQTEQANLTLNVNPPNDAIISSLEFLPGTDISTLTKDSEVIVKVNYNDDYSIDKSKRFTIGAIEASTTNNSVTYELSSEDTKFQAVIEDSTQTTITAPLTVLATLSDITVQASASSVESGSTITVDAQALYSDDTTANITLTANWSSDNITSLEYVTNSDTFLAKNVAGVANISASVNGIVSNVLAIDVTVPAANNPTPTTVTLDSIIITPANTQEIAISSNITFNAIGQYSDQSTQAITADVSWSSSNTAVLDSATSNNVFNGKSAGTATITASLDNIEAFAEVTVIQPAQSATNTLLSTSINPGSATIKVGESQTYTLTGKYSDNPTVDTAVTTNIDWAINNNGNNPVLNNNSATFTPNTAGSYTITATTEGIPKTANLIVEAINTAPGPNVNNIQILLANDNSNLISNSTNNSVVVRLNYNDGSSETITDQVTWEVENSQLLNIIGGNIETYAQLGQTKITATLESLGLQAIATINVVPNAGAFIKEIEISEPNITMLTNAFTTLNVKAIYNDGSKTLLTQGLSWFSADELIVTVDSTGQIKSYNLSSSTTVSAIYTDPISNESFTDGVSVNVFNNGSFDYIKIEPSNANSFTRVEGIADLNVRPIVQAFENPVGLLQEISLPSQNIGYYVTLLIPHNNERFALILNDLSLVNYDNSNATIYYMSADDNAAYVSTSETPLNITVNQFDTTVGGKAIGSFAATLCRIGWDCTQAGSTIEVNGDFFATLEAPKAYAGYEDKFNPKQIDESVLNGTQIIGTNSSYYQLATQTGTSYTIKAASSAANVSISVFATSDFVNNKLGDSLVEDASNQSITFIANGLTSFIQFNYDGAEQGNTFQISATALAPTAQGNATNPWVLPGDFMPIDYNKGQVDKTTSFYQTKVTQGVSYRVTIETNTNDLNLFAATTNSSTSFTNCPYSASDRFYRCVILADTENLFVKVDGSQTNGDVGRGFTLKIEYHAVEEELIVPTLNHQGQVSNGITMNIDTGGSGALNSSNSIYWIPQTQITANTYYLVSLTEFTDALQLWVKSPFNGNTLENGGCNTAGLPNTSEIYCLVKANFSGNIVINVISFSATGGSPYKISVRAITNNVYDVLTFANADSDCSPCSANELAFYREGETKAFAITSQDDIAYARKLIYADPGEKIYIQVTDPQRLGFNYGISVRNDSVQPARSFGPVSNPDIFEDGLGDNDASNATVLELNRISDHSLSNNNGNFGDQDWFVFTAP